jgi:hypothetical protein
VSENQAGVCGEALHLLIRTDFIANTWDGVEALDKAFGEIWGRHNKFDCTAVNPCPIIDCLDLGESGQAQKGSGRAYVIMQAFGQFSTVSSLLPSSEYQLIRRSDIFPFLPFTLSGDTDLFIRAQYLNGLYQALTSSVQDFDTLQHDLQDQFYPNPHPGIDLLNLILAAVSGGLAIAAPLVGAAFPVATAPAGAVAGLAQLIAGIVQNGRAQADPSEKNIDALEA